MSEFTEIDRIVNRHKARLLSQLEEVSCPAVYVQAVRNALDWLRSDLNEMEGREDEGPLYPPVRK